MSNDPMNDLVAECRSFYHRYLI